MSSLIVPRTGPDSLIADVHFLVPRPDRPFVYGDEPDATAPPASAEFEARSVQIFDARYGAPLSFDANGAALLHAPTAVRKFDDDGELSGRYYAESAEIISAALGANRTVVFDHNVRFSARFASRTDRRDCGRPVHRAHTDFTEASAARRLKYELGATDDELLRSRFLQINLWRPIRGPLRDAPLAVCDGATVAPQSLQAAELRYRDRSGEIYYLVHDSEQRWYYAPDMSSDEVWLLKNYDSAPRGASRSAPHCAFEDPRRHAYVLPRESIEVRAFAFFDA